MTRWTHLLILSGCILSIPAARSQTFKTRAELIPQTRAAIPLDATIDRDGSVYVAMADSVPVPPTFVRTSDGGRTWRAALGEPDQFGTITADPEDPDTVYRCGSTLRRTTDAGKIWYDVLNRPCDSFAIDSGNRRILIVVSRGAVYRSSDFGNTWNELLLEPANDPYVVPFGQSIIGDRSGFGRFMIIAAQRGLFWESSDRGATFSAVRAFSGRMNAASYDPFRPGSMFVVSDGAVYFRDQTGTWYLRSGAPQAYTVFADPQVPRRVWAATIGGLYRSTDDGQSWQRVLTGDYYTIKSCGSLYVTGFAGITWETRDSGNSWREFSRTISLDFGAGCGGYASLYPQPQKSTLSLRKLSNAGETVWNSEPVRAPLRLQPASNGRLGLVDGIVQFVSKAGTPELTPFATGVVASDLQIGDDGGFAIAGFVPGIATPWVHKADASGASQFLQQGTLLAIRPLDQGVAVQDASGRIGVRVPGSTTLEPLGHLPQSTTNMRYLPTRDYILAGIEDGNLWLARYAADATQSTWRTDVPAVKSRRPIRLSVDDAENVYVEVSGEGNRTFLQLDRNGKLEWLGTWPNRQFLLVEPSGTLSVISTAGGGARLESVDPKGRP